MISSTLMLAAMLRSPVLRAWRAKDTANGSSGLLTLPAWLSIACATTGRSVRTGAASVVTGLGANAARARAVDGASWGAAVENARTNLSPTPNAVNSWGFYGGASCDSTDGAVAPDGNTTADRFAWTTGTAGFSLGYTSPGPGIQLGAHAIGKWTAWIKADGATTAIDYGDGKNSNFHGIISTLSPSAWQLFEIAHGDYASTTCMTLGRWNDATPAGKAWVWGTQVEAGAYPTSLITGARAADVLTAPTPANIAPGGFYDVQMVVAPNYANNETAADHPWLYFGAGSQLYFKQSDRKLYLQVPGASDIVSGALTFARETALRVRATHKKGARRLQLWNDATGASIYDSGAQAAASALTLGASVGILGNGTTTAECADLRSVTVFR